MTHLGKRPDIPLCFLAGPDQGQTLNLVALIACLFFLCLCLHVAVAHTTSTIYKVLSGLRTGLDSVVHLFPYIFVHNLPSSCIDFLAAYIHLHITFTYNIELPWTIPTQCSSHQLSHGLYSWPLAPCSGLALSLSWA